jgi:rifampicin phosphotransferase
MLPLDACAGRTDAGHKAATLAKLRAAGLPAPDGVVVLPEQVVDPQALDAALTALGGGPFAVRSSGALEDAPGASAAGVFESVIGARDLSAVLAAIFRVRASAAGEPARAYLQARGITGDLAMAVLVQPVVKAERLAVAHSQPDGFRVETRPAGEPEWADVEATWVPRGDPGPLASGLRAIEALLSGPVDVELARSGEAITFLQARPLAPDPRVTATPDACFVVAGSWRLDGEHNPRPLSVAQASLVAAVERLGVGASQAVIGGYLYVSKAPPRGLTPIPLAELKRRFDGDVAPDCEARLAEVESGLALPPALAAFEHVYRRTVGEVSPSLARAKTQLDQLLRMNLGESLAQHGALLGGLGGATLARDQALWALGRGELTLADYLAAFGMYAPAWDVAAAPDDEAPERVQATAARWAADPRSPMARHADAVAQADLAAHAIFERLDRMARRAWKALHPLVREVLPIAEDDDRLFFRAQRAVRRALLSAGGRLVAWGALDAADDVFALSFAHADRPAAGLREEAARGRAALAAAEARVPPVAIDEGVPRHAPPSSRTVLRGHATAGLARGRAFVLRDPSVAPAALPDGAVLVVPAILPSLAYLLAGARALVTDHGGATSHGATLAREYGVPAVLGTRTATSLPDGAELYVDGASGRVFVL